MSKIDILLLEDVQSPWKHGQTFHPYSTINKGMAKELIGLTNILRNLSGIFLNSDCTKKHTEK